MTDIKNNRGGVNENLSPSERKPNTQYVLSLSYGKDSLACLGAIEELGLPLDRIIHAEIWATDDIPADLPPMIEFKKKADQIIKERYGIEVEHYCALNKGGYRTYEGYFYTIRNNKKYGRKIYGFPGQKFPWCNSRLKKCALKNAEDNLRENILQEDKEGKTLRVPEQMVSMVHRGTEDKSTKGFSKSVSEQDAKINTVSYIGIAIDEPERLVRLETNKVSPLALIGWTEEEARQWCIKNDLLSPIYTEETTRGGCWFCHNQSVNQLRLLRKNYPDLWGLLLKWDKDSPVTFKADGRTVHDFDKRFAAEDKGTVPLDRRFRWKMLDDLEL